jgi:hypothetical protein
MFVLSSFLQGLGDKYISFPVKKFDLWPRGCFSKFSIFPIFFHIQILHT